MHTFRDDGRKSSVTPSGIQALSVGLLLVFFMAVGAFSIREKSKTFDENSHYLYGRNILLNGDATRFDDSKMPVTALNVLPRKIGRTFPPGNFRSFLMNFWSARLVTLVFSAGIALVIFIWSRSLYGFVPAVFSLLLYVLDPNILAHSRLVTTDIYAMGSTVLVFFSLWRFARWRNVLDGILCALSLGFSMIAKYSAVVLIPLALLTLLVFELPAIVQAYKGHQILVIKKSLWHYAIYLAIVLVVSTLVINISFLSQGTFTRFSDYRFQSSFFRSLQQVPVLTKLPIPFPYPYLEGLDLVFQNERTGASYGNIYLLGQIHPGNNGFAGYYFIASLLKVPIASQVIYLLAFYFYLRSPRRRESFFIDDIFLFAPMLFFVIYYNFFFNTQIGIRYYLVVFPFLYVFSGHLFKGFPGFSVHQKMLAIGLIFYLFISVLSYYPNFLPYFNEIVWNRLQAYRFLADSNIDWGQNADELSAYLSAYPEFVYAPEKILPGQIILSVNQLTGVQGDPETYRWLRENFQPVSSISYTYLIYQISPEEIARLCSASEFCH